MSGSYSDIDSTYLDLPTASTDATSGRKTYAAGAAIITPGQKVQKLYVLVDGQIDVVRHLGESREDRTSYARQGGTGWYPTLGGRYLFTGKPSSLHYLALRDCTVNEIDETLIKRMYEDGTIVNLVRELIRCSDMSLEDACMDLTERYTLYGFPGFDHANLEYLLRHDPSRMRVENKDDLKAVEREFIHFARHMMRRWMGDWFASDPQISNLKLAPQPRP
ncbi:MAG: cyclic nucleotide-binding domain-containing protein [Patescibacteria group bacterium]|nr:MAG: cyclic nucleotide-binding domain-containing protein [Patescibacteria group bacterium]